ncbi:hydroxymethylglutaryl-CoA lyase [Caproicibacter fermentans]|uniref:Hydroxymethylglutaryl-CoA lyase n=1 Tax=Caproicibacter fermentans TaxID=2576756 RepID=A0A7G8T972_9FIRM|nr:hydroxymethylglutaryl-CoA lyase [Caproicibacter fermentans]QNK40163.1 hydroxymethylglutaryl-CoA lyase [Caproicibacter fermentans]
MKKIDVIEVGPRDGFQNLPDYLPVSDKLTVIDNLVQSGVKHMQITSFVNPKAIPQMKDAGEVARACLRKYPELDLFALIPNFRGAQSAREAGIKKVTNVISLSVSHNKANINRTHDESFAELAKIKESFPELDVCLDVATAFGCPFEGKFRRVEPLLGFLQRAWGLGVTTFNLCDTVGLADPAQVRLFLKAVKEKFPAARVEIHIHDTRNMGLVNTLAAVESGIDGVQATLGGLGGCPFAPGASGNTATEDLVLMLNEMGYETGISFEKILAAAKAEYQMIPNGIYSGHNIRIKSGLCC